jgi:DNA-binding SARP family transcriptional activator
MYAVIIAAAIGGRLAFAWQEMSLRIYLTGRIAIEVDGQVVVDERRLRGRQGRLVFAYLVCERTRPVSREELATIVWPEETAPSWESALSALTSRLGGLLSAQPLKSEDVRFARGLGHYQIHLPVDVWVDLEAGVSAIDRAESALRSGATDQVLGPATVAATIARRPFLSGIDGFWEDSQRRKLERQLVRALDCLAEMRIASGEPDLAVETAIEAVGLDPFRERSHRLLMQGYASTGNRARAVGAYHALRERLAEELGTEPAPETEALYLKLLSQ